MPLGSRKLSAFKNKFNAGAGGAPVAPSFAISESFSGNSITRVDLTTSDANTVVFSITSNRPNAQVSYIIDDLGSNLTSSDFTDNTLTANVTLDSNGSANVSKTITSTTGSGHKSLRFRITRTTDNTANLALGSTLNLYEVTPITMSGGDTTETSNIANDPAITGTGIVMLGSSRLHTYSTAGNANLVVSSLGNYEGNANLWNNQYQVTNTNFSYWGDTTLQTNNVGSGLGVRALLVGGGGNNGNGFGGGAGEVGFLKFPIANISPGTYTMTVAAGLSSSDTTSPMADSSIMFNGNSSLSKYAIGGGNGGGKDLVSTPFNYPDPPGGSQSQRSGWGRGGSAGGAGNFVAGQATSTGIGNYLNATAVLQGSGNYTANTDLSAVTFAPDLSVSGTALRQYVYFAAGTEGAPDASSGSATGGGGAARPGGFTSSSGTTAYGHPRRGDGPNKGGGGLSLPRNKNAPDQTGKFPIYSNGFDLTFRDSPLFNMTNANVEIAGGQGSSSNGLGASGYGGGTGQDGVIALNYPYRPAYRLITKEDLS